MIKMSQANEPTGNLRNKIKAALQVGQVISQ